MVFETGLPTRYYVSRTDVRFQHLVPTDTVTACPYKGMTSGYWSVQSGGVLHKDLAWAYDFPTRQLLPITGMVAFYNEKSTRSSMASCSSARRRTSPDRAGMHAETLPHPARDIFAMAVSSPGRRIDVRHGTGGRPGQR